MSSAVTATAFGLDICAAGAELPFLRGARAAPTGRRLELSVLRDETVHEHWPRGAEVVCDERLPGGGPNFAIERHAAAGYLIHGPAYGAHLLAADATGLRCFPEARSDGAWQRLLIGQVLPFAALLSGLEVFHASAVLSGGRALAFLGPSGAGKTSLALALCDAGALFMADDAVAVERGEQQLIAHPGTAVAGVEGATSERMVEMRAAAGPAPLDALFFLDRSPDGPERPEFTTAVDAPSLLAATFNFVLAGPERLTRLLDVSALAARLRVELLRSGTATAAADLAAAVMRRLDE